MITATVIVLEGSETLLAHREACETAALVIKDGVILKNRFKPIVDLPAMTMLEKAIHIAVTRHAGAVDKGGEPYILHPLRVMARVRGDICQTIAVLHDVIEDTDCTIEDLREARFPGSVIRSVQLLTKNKAEPYDSYIDRIACVANARAVKIADLEDNMDVRRLKGVTDKDFARMVKYRQAWQTLTAKLGTVTV